MGRFNQCVLKYIKKAVGASEIKYSVDTLFLSPLQSLMKDQVDIFLDFCKGKKQFVLGLKSGHCLFIRGKYLYAEQNGKVQSVLRFSKKFIDEIEAQAKNGYYPTKAKVRFIVAWKGKEDTEETAVILPEIYFGRG